VLEVAQAGQGVGHARHRRFRQAGLARQFLVTQHAFAGGKTAQQFQASGQRGDELPILVFLLIVAHRIQPHVFKTMGACRCLGWTWVRVATVHGNHPFFVKSTKQNMISLCGIVGCVGFLSQISS